MIRVSEDQRGRLQKALCIGLFLMSSTALCAEPAAEDIFLSLQFSGGLGVGPYVVSLAEDGGALVEMNGWERKFAYRTTLTEADLAWFHFIIDSTDFDNPERRPLAGSCSGTLIVEAKPNGQFRRVEFGHDDAFNDLLRLVWRLVHQAKLIDSFNDRADIHGVLDSLRRGRVLQPSVFHQPLLVYLRKPKAQHMPALHALAYLTTASEWGGEVKTLFAEASDEPDTPSPTFSPRRRLLSIVTYRNFYAELLESHQASLLPIYREQAQIEAEKNDSRSESNLRIISEAEKVIRGKDTRQR